MSFHVDLVALELVERWQCQYCGRKFRRVTRLDRVMGHHPPAGFEVHRRACVAAYSREGFAVAPRRKRKR